MSTIVNLKTTAEFWAGQHRWKPLSWWNEREISRKKIFYTILYTPHF